MCNVFLFILIYLIYILFVWEGYYFIICFFIYRGGKSGFERLLDIFIFID